MISKKILYVFVIVIALLVITMWQTGFMMGHLDAHASQCIGGLTLEDNYKSYDYIFSGRVESIDYSKAPTNVTLWVYNTWKGNTTQYMSVAELFPKDPLLGFLFVEGQDYLIFSSSDNRINMSTVNGCSPSGSLEESHDIVMQLEEITNYTNSKKPCNSDRVACYADQIVCDRSEWDCRSGDSTGVFSKVIELPEPVEPIPTKEELAKASILCIGGYKQYGSECVPDDTLTISYGPQWILKIILIIAILIAISLGVILGVKVWRKRK